VQNLKKRDKLWDESLHSKTVDLPDPHTHTRN